MFTPLQTERLTIRTVDLADLDALVARRNDPEVAKYQSWVLPFSREEGEQLLRGASEMDGPTNDEWWMATIVEQGNGAPIGHIAAHATWGGRSVEIGYEIATEYQGSGFAAEATDEFVRYLFEDFGATRVSAMMHPDHLASAMVAERAGLVFEGQTKLSYWVGEGETAENSDDLLYGVTRDDWNAWRSRPTGRPTEVSLIEIDQDNQGAVEKLETHRSQTRLVAPVVESFGDAFFASRSEKAVVPLLRAIEADGELAGFVMLAMVSEHNPEPYLWRLLVDRRHQRRGIGAMAMDQVEEMLRGDGHRSLRLSWMPGRGSPEPFYVGRGFEPTGKMDGDEVEARKML